MNYEEKNMIKYFGKVLDVDTTAKKSLEYLEKYFNTGRHAVESIIVFMHQKYPKNTNEHFQKIWNNDLSQMIVQSAQMEVIKYDTAIRQLLAVFIIDTHFNKELSENMVAQTKSYKTNEEYKHLMIENVCSSGLVTTLKTENLHQTSLWWQKNYYLRNTPSFQEKATHLEYCIKYGSINDINMLMKEYWYWMNIYMVEAFVENKHIFSSNVHKRNQHPLTIKEYCQIVNKSSTYYKEFLLQLLPDCSWRVRLNMGDVRELKRKCNGPYFEGVVNNGVHNLFQREQNETNKDQTRRQRRVRLEYFMYNMIMKKTLKFSDRLVHNPKNRECRVPNGMVCLNPYCYDPVCRHGTKRPRSNNNGMTEDQQEIANDIMKKHPWAIVSKKMD